MFRFLIRFIWLAWAFALLLPITSAAQTCDEAYPVPIDFELVVLENRVEEDFPGQFTYNFRYVIETTVEPASGGTILYNGQPPGTEFRSFSTVDNREAIFVSARVDGESLGSKKFIWQPSIGLLPGPVADFSFAVDGNRVTYTNESTNTNGVNIYYDWDFGLGASPFIFRGDEPPVIEYRQPGTFCVRLDAAEATGGFGPFDLDPLDQRDRILKEVTIELDSPIADFNAEVLGRLVRLENTSRHPFGKSMSYTWDFGDGNGSTEFSPEHVYESPGEYTISLTARDIDGGTDTDFQNVVTEFALVIEATANAVIEQNEDELVRFTVYNYERDDVGSLQVPLTIDPLFLEQIGIAEPAILRSLAQGDSFTSYYTVQGRQAGDTVMTLRATGSLASGGATGATAELPISIQPDVTVDIVAPSVEAAGEEVDITVTVTNNEMFPITGARLDSLVVTPSNALSLLGSPTGGDGDPRVSPFTLGPGESITFTFRYRAEETGIIDLSALATYSTQSGGRYAAGDQARFAVDTAALAISDLRMSGGPPSPGAFTVLRGTVSNVGNYDVTGIDFQIANSVPVIAHLESSVQRLSPGVSPRIPVLAPGESQGFLIPINVELDVGDATRYTLPLRFSGNAEVGGDNVSVVAEAILRDSLDRTDYWVDILDQVKAQMLNRVLDFFDDVDSFAEDSLIGGIAVGGGDALLAVLQRLGDGELAAVDFVGRTVGDGGEQLTLQGKQMVNV
ncbi:MAG: PKD domain-containing protein, partial [Pseudomonadota bacterium]